MSIEMLYEDFKKFSSECTDKEDWMCSRSKVVCKDYICPKLAQMSAMGLLTTKDGISKIK